MIENQFENYSISDNRLALAESVSFRARVSF